MIQNPKVGMRVKLINKNNCFPLKHRSEVIGRITHVYVADCMLVKWNWVTWESEVYACELEYV